MFKDNGTVTGVMGRIQREEVDMPCLLYQKSVQRLEKFDYSQSVAEACSIRFDSEKSEFQITPTFIVREYPVTLSSLIFTCARPYQIGVWICIAVSFVLQVSHSLNIYVSGKIIVGKSCFRCSHGVSLDGSNTCWRFENNEKERAKYSRSPVHRDYRHFQFAWRVIEEFLNGRFHPFFSYAGSIMKTA